MMAQVSIIRTCLYRGLRTRHQHGHVGRRIIRCIYSKTGTWDNNYTPSTRREVEVYWNKQILQYNENLACKKDQPTNKEKYYVLSMFPYPSGKLHMGHVRVYTISDAVAHFHRMNGKLVLHPIGWDAFGLPAENAAIERGLQADEWTYSNIDYMRKQLKDLSMCFNWERLYAYPIPTPDMLIDIQSSKREFATCDPSYYRWTQFLFVKMYKAGLAYQNEAVVNWDPVDETVLANEQVDGNRRSWRSGAKVEKRLMRQWFLKTTHYFKALVDCLHDLDGWPKGIKNTQAQWIGDCDGCTFNFKIEGTSGDIDMILPAHTVNPELIHGAAYLVIPPANMLLVKPEFLRCLTDEVKQKMKQLDDKQQTINVGISAVHPLTNKSLPIYISNSTLFFTKGGIHITPTLGIPSASKDQAKFAEKNGIEWIPVLHQGGDTLVNSKKFSGLSRSRAREAILDYVEDNSIIGEAWTNPRQLDWLISRQRFWGTPIPIIHCPDCKAVPVPESDLPVKLPKLQSVSGKGLSPLLDANEWINVTCPRCGNSNAKRETDTMDTFVDSAWYFLRYTDAHNETLPFARDKADDMMPVDMYIGGVEHALMHLLYARFFNHFLHDQRMVSHKEPFKRLLVQGLVKGQSYKVPSTGQYLAPNEVDFTGDEPVAKETGEKLIVRQEKMSKSRHNGINPEELLAEYGPDAVRLAVLGMAPTKDILWDKKDLKDDWIQHAWHLIGRFIKLRTTANQSENNEINDESFKTMCNETINQVTSYYESKDCLLNKVIRKLQLLTNNLSNASDDIIRSSVSYERALCSLCVMMAPLAPHVASEMWKGICGVPHHVTTDFDWKKNVLEQQWPRAELSDTTQLMLQINNTTIDILTVPMKHANNPDALKELVLNSEDYYEHFENAAIQRVIHVPNRKFRGTKIPYLNFLLEKD